MDSILFSPKNIGNLVLKNRFVRSATHDMLCDKEGFPTKESIFLHNQLAEGEVGLIIAGVALVQKAKNNYLMHEDKCIDPWKRITDQVHARGSAIALQLSHPGRQALPGMSGLDPIGPSPVPMAHSWPIPREMTIADIEKMIERYAQSSRRASEAGFDAVQIHAGHGYLISTFLSPQANIRKDNYGGSTLKRMRFLEEIIARIREITGPEYPVMVKLNFNDGIEDGLKPDEAADIAERLAEKSVDAIEVTAGTMASIEKACPLGISDKKDEACNREYAAILKNRVQIPISLVGGNRTPEVMSALVQSGVTDFVSMCRPLIREPLLVAEWKNGRLRKAKCISCNRCLSALQKGEQPRCQLDIQ
jgi:2,4-dienoyl-CoA reductase-like NADH-dependent reductase (Old Yellow Enzyme family)